VRSQRLAPCCNRCDVRRAHRTGCVQARLCARPDRRRAVPRAS
jgi:hypothetical protein